MENDSKITPKDIATESLLATFLATFSEHRILDAYWSTFGSLLAHFWLPLGSLWLTFGSGSFWFPLGDLLALMRTLLVPFG